MIQLEIRKNAFTNEIKSVRGSVFLNGEYMGDRVMKSIKPDGDSFVGWIIINQEGYKFHPVVRKIGNKTFKVLENVQDS